MSLIPQIRDFFAVSYFKPALVCLLKQCMIKKFVQTLDQNINHMLICIKQLIFWSKVCELLINWVLKRKVVVLGLPYLFKDED